VPAVDLRELVKTPIDLTGKFSEPGNPHPLHSGIPGEKRYTSPGGPPIPLPKGGAGLERLKRTLSSAVPSMDHERALESQVKLLTAAPSLHVRSGPVAQGPDGKLLPEALAVRTRTVLLTGVFRDPEEALDGGQLTSPRFGAVGTLTVIPDVDPKRGIEDAWLNVKWAHSSREMLSELLRVPGLDLQTAKKNRRLEVLIAEDLVVERPDLKEVVARLLQMLGASPQIHVVTEQKRGTIASKIKANNPFQLLALGASVDEMVVSEFTKRHGEQKLFQGQVNTADDAVDWLLDRLPLVMGISPALLPHPEAEPAAGRPRMPVTIAAKCLHHKENHYVLDEGTGVWWTRDYAQHGQCIFKTYSLIDGALVWKADRDAAGAIITTKYKGPEGTKIAVSATSSCSFPASHLS